MQHRHICAQFRSIHIDSLPHRLAPCPGHDASLYAVTKVVVWFVITRIVWSVELLVSYSLINAVTLFQYEICFWLRKQP